MKKIRPATLSDYDNIRLKEIDEKLNQIKPLEGEALEYSKEIRYCRKCSGILSMIEPMVAMAGMVLFECSECKEREYL